MRLTEILKRRFVFLLAVLVLLQVLPVGVIAQKSGLSQKAVNQEAAAMRQELADQQEQPRGNGASWRPKLAADLEQSVDAVSVRGSRDKMSRVIIQLKDKAPAGQSIKGIMVTDIKKTMLADPLVRADL